MSSRSHRARAGAALQRFATTAQRGTNSATPPPEPHWKIETLEPRLLMSGDAMPGVHMLEGSIEQPGEQDRFEFVVTEKTRYLFDGLQGEQIQWQLKDGNGTNLFSRSLTDIGDAFLELNPGKYSITVGAVGDKTGDYAFRLIGIEAAQPLEPNERAQGTLEVGTQAALYSVQLEAGDRLYFEPQTDNPAGRWTLFAPDATVAVSQRAIDADHGPFVAQQSGTYWLSLEGQREATSALDYGFTLHRHAARTQALELGQSYELELSGYGDGAAYTFALDRNTQVQWDQLSAALNNVQWRIDNVNTGATLVSGYTSSEDGIQAPSVLGPGNYVLRITAEGRGQGNLSFRLLASSRAVAAGEEVPVSSDAALGGQVVRVEVTQSDPVFVAPTADIRDTSDPGEWMVKYLGASSDWEAARSYTNGILDTAGYSQPQATGNSAWVAGIPWIQQRANESAGYYSYATTISIANADPTVSFGGLSIKLSADNWVAAFVINGVLYDGFAEVPNEYSYRRYEDVFIPLDGNISWNIGGDNTVEIIIYNSGGPTGFSAAIQPSYVFVTKPNLSLAYDALADDEPSATVRWTLTDASGLRLGSGSLSVGQAVTLALPSAGHYYLWTNPDFSGNVPGILRLAQWHDEPPVSIALSAQATATVERTLTHPGQTQVQELTVTDAGMWVFEPTQLPEGAQWRLTGPRGIEFDWTALSASQGAAAFVRYLMPGSYRLEVRAAATTQCAGAFAASFKPLKGLPTLTPGQADNSLSGLAVGESMVWRADSRRYDDFRLTLSALTSDYRIRAFDAYGRELAVDEVSVRRGLAIVMLVGEGMLRTVGTTARASRALSGSNINIEVINQGASEVSLMFGIDEKDADEAVRCLYKEFFPAGNGR